MSIILKNLLLKKWLITDKSIKKLLWKDIYIYIYKWHTSAVSQNGQEKY